MSVCSDKTDEEIPFDPPIVSKFGPISRSCKTKYKSTDPVQATANQVISLSLSPPLFLFNVFCSFVYMYAYQTGISNKVNFQ